MWGLGCYTNTTTIYRENREFWGNFELIYFVIPIISLNKFSYINVYIVGVIKKIRIFIIFVILLLTLKNINMFC